MAFFNVRTAQVQPDRRVAHRRVVDCDARFAMAGGTRLGRLIDLSEHGARFESADPPVKGTPGFLRWNDQDHYCTVIWSAADRCGFQFERPIASGVVEASCRHVEVGVKPVATVSHIQMGRRRGRLAAEE